MGGLGGTSSLSPLCLWIPVFIGVAVVCVSVNVSAELQRLEHPAVNKADASSISFLVIGEWGRKGTYNQSRVAFQVSLSLTLSFSLVLLLHIPYS
jgi:hypothetical protein